MRNAKQDKINFILLIHVKSKPKLNFEFAVAEAPALTIKAPYVINQSIGKKTLENLIEDLTEISIYW